MRDFAPLIRVAVKRDVGVRNAVQPEIDAVSSYEAGRVRVLLDLGMVGQFTRDDRRLESSRGAVCGRNRCRRLSTRSDAWPSRLRAELARSTGRR